jgi:hypothetical protein
MDHSDRTERGGREESYARHVETDLIETERLLQRPPSKRERAARKARPALVSTEVLAAPKETPSLARFASVGRAGRVYEVGVDPALRTDPIRAALDEGFQCLIGLDFAAATHVLARAGEGGLAILDGNGATNDAITALKSRGVLPVVHHLAVAHGVNATLTAARARTVELCVSAAKRGFAGVLMDDLRRIPDERDAADLKKAVEGARAQAGHATFSAVLRGGDLLVLGHTWLVEQGLVSAIVMEGVSFRANARARAGMRVTSSERRAIDARVARVRARFPALPLVAVDHVRDRTQAEQAKTRARELQFDVAHVCLEDALCERLSPFTTVGMRDDDPTMPLGSLIASRPR